MYQSKEDSLARLHELVQQLETDTDGDFSVAIVAANNKTGDVRLMGMNVSDEEMCGLLASAAEVVFDSCAQQATDRVLN